DGSLAYLAEVRIKRNGRLRRESKTFERRGQATEWAASVEKQLSAEEGDRHEHRQLHSGSLRKILRKYRKDVSEVRPMGRSKTASIKFLEKVPLAGIPCSTCGVGSDSTCKRAPEIRCRSCDGQQRPCLVANHPPLRPCG